MKNEEFLTWLSGRTWGTPGSFVRKRHKDRHLDNHSLVDINSVTVHCAGMETCYRMIV